MSENDDTGSGNGVADLGRPEAETRRLQGRTRGTDLPRSTSPPTSSPDAQAVTTPKKSGGAGGEASLPAIFPFAGNQACHFRLW